MANDPKRGLSILIKIASVLLLVGLGGGIFFYFKVKSQTHGTLERSYTSEQIMRRNVERTILTTGMLTPRTTVEVSSQISGLINLVNVDFNTPVKKGDILAQIEPSTFQQKLRQAEADLVAAEANHRMLHVEVDRHAKLLAANMTTQQDYDRASALLQQAAAGLLTRRAAVENARLDLERCTLVSPIDGIVIYKAVEAGKTIAASLSAPTLFVVSQNLQKMRIIAPVTEADIMGVRVGQEVTFRVDAMRNRTFQGRLAQIRNPYTTADASNKTSTTGGGITSFDCVIDVDNPDLVLLPGLNAIVSIIVERATGALCVPNSAFRVRIGQTTVNPQSLATAHYSLENSAMIYVLGPDANASTARPVRVKLGVSDGVVTEVSGEIKEGERVVTGISIK